MRPYSIGGMILIALGVVALAIRSVTYFSTEVESGPLGFFAWEVTRPHTIFINPIAGIIAIAIGLGLIFMTRRQTAT